MEKILSQVKFIEIIKEKSDMFEIVLMPYLLGNGTTYGVALLIREEE